MTLAATENQTSDGSIPRFPKPSYVGSSFFLTVVILKFNSIRPPKTVACLIHVELAAGN